MMKSKPYLFSLFAAGLSIVLMSNDNGVTTAQAKDRTGSPVGLTQRCEQCHTGASFTVTISNRLKDALGNIVTSYTPGQTYTYEVEFTSTGASKYGFQTVGIFATSHAQAGTLTASSTNSKIKGLSGRTYGEHVSPSSSSLFKLNWVAPAAGMGTVNFYASGIGCNGTGTTSGDKSVLAPVLAITENVSSGIDTYSKIELNVFPNPATHVLTITTNIADTYSYGIVNFYGQLVQSGTLNSGVSQHQLNIESLPKGTYAIYVTGPKNASSGVQSFIKL